MCIKYKRAFSLLISCLIQKMQFVIAESTTSGSTVALESVVDSTLRSRKRALEIS